MHKKFRTWLALWGTRGDNAVRQRHWRRIMEILQCSHEEAKEFGRLFLEYQEGLPLPSEAPRVEEPPANEVSKETSFEHHNNYWYDAERDVYVVFLPHLARPLALPARIWGDIKASYSQWDGSPATVEQIARKCGLTRRTVTAILRAFSHTHTGSPWTREFVATADENHLVEDLLLAKEEKILRRAEEASWDKVKKKAEAFDRLQHGALDALTDWLATSPPVRAYQGTVTPPRDRANLIVLGITDLHMGSPDHDAPGILWSALENLLSRVATPLQWVLPIGGDNLHYDTANYTTTNGTRMEGAIVPARNVVGSYMDLYAELISRLAETAPVYCVPVAGNHDRMMSYATFAAMRLAFMTHPNVTFSGSLENVQVVTFGETLVALHHGDLHKPEDMGGIIPRDFPDDWGSTRRHYCLMGHYHSQGTFGTKSGLECIYMPSLVPSDEWHRSHGWKNDPSMSAYEFSVSGLTAIYTSRG